MNIESRYHELYKKIGVNTIICTTKEVDDEIEELGNRFYKLDVDIELDIKYKTRKSETRNLSEGVVEYGTPVISTSIEDIAQNILDEYLKKYLGSGDYCEIEEIKINFTKIRNIRIETTTCEFCGYEFENDDDYWGVGCQHCCSEVCLDCLKDYKDYGRMCPTCLESVKEEEGN